MAKTKRKKLSENIHSKREKMKSIKSLNPFEIHINNEKMKVLGRKMKHDRGLPGVSRAKALQKRKNTLFQEYKLQNKSNKFVDRRIGERNMTLSSEDKIMARFAAVRTKAHNKKSIFNLADDEVLTHKGQSVSEIEKFDDPRSDDEDFDEDEKTGNLDRDFVKEAHFGGGILKRTGKEGAKTHKELIDQLISESKKRKAEKQKIKEATVDLTEKLDSEWKDLLPLVNKNKKTPEDAMDSPKVDDYDKVMRELRFEARGTVSDRLKSEEEIAKEEKEKLEQLEKDRLERMKGVVEKKISNHRSADDLDDGYVYEEVEEQMISYNDEGECNIQLKNPITDEADGRESADKIEENEDKESESEETDSEDDLSDLKAETSDSENEIETIDVQNSVDNSTKIIIKEDQVATKEIVENVTNNETNDTGSEGNVTNSKTNVTNTKINVTKNETNDIKNETNDTIMEKDVTNSEANERQDQSVDEIKAELLKRKDLMDKAREELPYTFSLPKSYEELAEVLEKKKCEYQGIIIERMIKCNHASLAEGNKNNLGLLFAYLLQYLNDVCTEVNDQDSVKNSFAIFSVLAPHLFSLAQLNHASAHNAFVEVIKEKFEDYQKKPKRYPELEILFFLKLVSLLFSTSDFRHQVVTPCFVFMEQVLTRCRVKTRRDISYGLFVSTLVLEYTFLSKRFLPAVINFLGGILHMSVPKSAVRLYKVSPPFKAKSSDLVLLNDCSNDCLGDLLKMESTDLIDAEINDGFKIRTLNTTLGLLKEFLGNLKSLSSNVEIFEGISRYLKDIPVEKYPEIVRNKLCELDKDLVEMESSRKLEYLVTEVERPKALRLYEPRIEEVYDGKRFKVQSKEKAERDKLLHKIKKERKGALREIRRDNAFLGRVKIKEQIQSDKERQAKVKRIFAQASSQQSELNELDRKRKRK